MSPATAAGVANVPCWVILALLRTNVLSTVIHKGYPRVRNDELKQFLANHRPETAA